MIPLIASVTRFARVPVPHTNDATYALDAEGNEWVAKREADMGCEALLAEALTWLIARQVGVRVPDAAFCTDPGERAWLSRRLPNAIHWSAELASQIANREEAGAIIALDAVVFNEARHGRNLLVTGSGKENLATIWAIDADEAMVGHVAEFEELGVSVPDPRIHATGFPANSLRAHALTGAALAAGLPPALLEEFVTESCTLAREPRVGDLLSALIARCAIAVQLTNDYLDRLEARQ